MSTRHSFCVILSVSILLGLFSSAAAQSRMAMRPALSSQEVEVNNQIRREKFDLVLPEVMKKNNVDMWIHVIRRAIPDDFGAGEFGSTSGVFVFTDRWGDRIERAVLGRRWIIHDPVRRQEPIGNPMTEYDYRFAGLKEFVEVRNPKRIAVNFKHDLGPYETTDRSDGISLTDYLLLIEELGDEFANRLVSSEYVMMDYIIRKVPSEIQQLKKIRRDEDERIKKVFAEIVPGVTKRREAGATVFRRGSTGISQRGRRIDDGSVIQRGDIIAAPSQGMYAYVLRKGEKEPPPEIKKLWTEYLKIDKILTESIRVGLTAREIKQIYKQKFDDEGIIVRDAQLHYGVDRLKNNFSVYSTGFDPEKTQLSIDCHGMMKGARDRKNENYFGPRIGSLGPEWTWDIPLPPNHHFVLEYFFYMPSPSSEREDQYLFWWDHEQAIVTEKGVEYLSPLRKELYLIK
ncbi:MAG: hypothetical protein JRI52_03730 [Deltaproteobacteria bacterium]|nr:hypothetical protein [Deltaproteobacteria bacterium]